MKTLPPAYAVICLVFGLTAGCAQIDPYQRPGMWHPEAVNARNLAAEIQDPHDLIRGHGASGPEWNTRTGAVDRLWQDKVKPLLDGKVSPSASADAPPAAGAH